ncbi:MAG TPA: efflux transporter outer membrane subunit [Crocinitomicaceae bacterium]|nr:efflux transporter outer membrane subunit [Crocinitomicaceae bacterium]
MKISNILYFSILTVFLVSCGLKDRYQQPEIAKELQENLIRDNVSKDTVSLANISWQEFFTDETLKALIQEGLNNNYDLQNAIIQIAATEAALRQSKLAFLPNLNFAPTTTFNNQSKHALNLPPNININLQTTTISLGLTSNWEIDIWGKLASQKRANLANWLSIKASKNAVQTALVANIANMYYTLLALDKQLKITKETIVIREKSVQAIKALNISGTATSVDIAQAESNLYAAEITRQELKQAIREAENMICVLLASPMKEIPRGNFDNQTMNSELKIGVPMLLLSNRPDVKAAEMQFRKEYELVNVAKASFYPSLNLNAGSMGISALTTRALFNINAFFLNLVGGITQPIFSRGVLKSNLKQQQVRQEVALNTFKNTLIKAGYEVSNAMFAYQTISDKKEFRDKQIEALKTAVHASTQLLQFSSRVTYTDVLVSEQNLINAQLNQVNDQLLQYKAMIELYRALGGGLE